MVICSFNCVEILFFLMGLIEYLRDLNFNYLILGLVDYRASIDLVNIGFFYI